MESPVDPDITPAMPPPDGVIPNFIDPPTIAPSLTVGLVLLCGIATLAFTARMFTRVYVMKQMQLEDYLLIFGWALSIVFFSFIFAQVPFSIGRDQYNVNLTQMALFLQYVNLTEIFYILSMFFLKLSILAQLKTIFRGSRTSTTPAIRDWIYYLFLTLMALVAAYNLATAIALIAQCVPRAKIWTPSLPGTCVDIAASTIASGAFNLLLDILIFLLPLYAISRLKLAPQRKWAIAAVFAIGLLACISSLLRLYYSVHVVSAADLTRNMVDLCWTSALETASAVLVACVPVMPRLWRFLRGERPAGSRGASGRPSYATPTAASASWRASRRGKTGKGSVAGSRDAWIGQYADNKSFAGAVSGNATLVNHDWLPLADAEQRTAPRQDR